MKKKLIVFGTRPEAIKMAPLVKELYNYPKEFDVRVCVTGQHRQMLDQVLDFFELKPDYDMNLMKLGQDLFGLTSDVLMGLQSILKEFQPDYVYVHGDTTTSFAASLAAFYHATKVCHVEAGLRTNNKWSPFPEEMNRQLTARIADYHFTPTDTSKQNLLKENIPSVKIKVTGNTVIDALLYSASKVEDIDNSEIDYLKSIINLNRKMILVTGHRRENFGAGFKNICCTLTKIAFQNKDIQLIYPVHLNPNVKEVVYQMLGNISNVYFVNPLSYPAFVWLMNRAYFIVTDSGGVQEEAPSLGKPVLVLRDTTERPEAVLAGTVQIVGTRVANIVKAANDLLRDSSLYVRMSQAHNPYGDGDASKRIVQTFR